MKNLSLLLERVSFTKGVNGGDRNGRECEIVGAERKLEKVRERESKKNSKGKK